MCEFIVPCLVSLPQYLSVCLPTVPLIYAYKLSTVSSGHLQYLKKGAPALIPELLVCIFLLFLHVTRNINLSET